MSRNRGQEEESSHDLAFSSMLQFLLFPSWFAFDLARSQFHMGVPKGSRHRLSGGVSGVWLARKVWHPVRVVPVNFRVPW